jgi:hypothetical protein
MRAPAGLYAYGMALTGSQDCRDEFPTLCHTVTFGDFDETDGLGHQMHAQIGARAVFDG